MKKEEMIEIINVFIRRLAVFNIKIRLYKPDAHVNVLKDALRWVKDINIELAKVEKWYNCCSPQAWENMKNTKLDLPEMRQLNLLIRNLRSKIRTNEKPIIFKREKKFKELENK